MRCSIYGPWRRRVWLRLLALVVTVGAAGCSTTAPHTSRLPLVLPLPAVAGTRRPAVERWQAWAARHVHNGDIIFIRGESHILLGLVNFSQLCMQLTDSPFSHVAAAAWEDGKLVVYDIIRDGARRTPWGEFVGDRLVHTIAIKRLRPEYQQHIPEALAYCRQVYESKVPFDQAFKLGNERLYCSELVEIAFRRAGVALSAPVRVDELPGYVTLGWPTKQLIEVATPLRATQEVLVPGNAAIGIWASPYLEAVLAETPTNSPPDAAPAVARR